jgi:hypothetical protein
VLRATSRLDDADFVEDPRLRYVSGYVRHQ